MHDWGFARIAKVSLKRRVGVENEAFLWLICF